MATILVFNPNTQMMERYSRQENDVMPYITGRSLLVREFRGSSRAGTLWTDRRVMETWNRFRQYYGKPIRVGYAFKRIWEGGHGNQSQHYAGTAFDTGQNLGPAQLEELRRSAQAFGGWTYVEPAYLAPTWVHFDRRFGAPACPGGGYPLQRLASRGIYVLVLQDALSAIGYDAGGLDGIFGQGTARAVRSFQSASGLAVDGAVGCATWTALTARAKGIGRTNTVIYP